MFDIHFSLLQKSFEGFEARHHKPGFLSSEMKGFVQNKQSSLLLSSKTPVYEDDKLHGEGFLESLGTSHPLTPRHISGKRAPSLHSC